MSFFLSRVHAPSTYAAACTMRPQSQAARSCVQNMLHGLGMHFEFMQWAGARALVQASQAARTLTGLHAFKHKSALAFYRQAAVTRIYLLALLGCRSTELVQQHCKRFTWCVLLTCLLKASAECAHWSANATMMHDHSTIFRTRIKEKACAGSENTPCINLGDGVT